MAETIYNIGWAMIFAIVGGVVGMVLVIASSLILPGLIDRLTPNIDEQKEIAPATRPSASILEGWWLQPFSA